MNEWSLGVEKVGFTEPESLEMNLTDSSATWLSRRYNVTKNVMSRCGLDDPG